MYHTFSKLITAAIAFTWFGWGLQYAQAEALPQKVQAARKKMIDGCTREGNITVGLGEELVELRGKRFPASVLKEVDKRFITRADLTGDGLKDWILDWSYTCSSGCGSGGCRLQIFVSKSNAGPRKMHSSNAVYDAIDVPTMRWYDLKRQRKGMRFYLYKEDHSGCAGKKIYERGADHCEVQVEPTEWISNREAVKKRLGAE